MYILVNILFIYRFFSFYFSVLSSHQHIILICNEGCREATFIYKLYTKIEEGILKNTIRDVLGGPVVKRLQCRVPGFDPCPGNSVLHAANKGLNASSKDPTCHKQRSCML